MGRWKSLDERLELGERAVYLRDVEKLLWKVIAERLGIPDVTQTIKYYKKYKTSLLIVKSEMSLKQIEEFSRQYNIERGWVWLYENGFRKRVPMEVQQKIEDGKLGIGARPKESQAQFEKRNGRRNGGGKMGHRRPRQEQLELGKRAVHLRDVKELTWRQIAERLGVKESSSVQIYYKKYKVTSPFLKEERYG